MSNRCIRVLACAALGCAAAALAQPAYRSVSPEGKVTYSDKPPVATAPMPAAPGAPPRPAAGGVQPTTAVPVVPAVPREIVRQGPETEAYRACVRDNMRALELVRAAEEVARTAASLRAATSAGAAADYQRALLDRQFQHYRSLGGTAATPDAVGVPVDPCAPIADTLRRQQAEDHARYQQCAAGRAREVRLAAVSREIVESRAWIVAAERLQAERQANPARFQDTRGSGEWARLASMDAAQLRAGQAALFAEYRASGGPAARVEDVTALPNPCLQRTLAEGERPPGASPVSAVRATAAPGR